MTDVTPGIWKPVPGYEGLYEASDFGQVLSRHRKVPHTLRPSWYTGYGVVMLHRDGQREPRTVHSIVMETFAGPCPPGQEIRHLDGDPANNRWTPGSTEDEIRAAGGNLIYGSSSENKVDQVRHGTHYEAARDCCDNGHEFTPANTRIVYWPDGSFRQRSCRACHNDATKERWRNLDQKGERCTSDEGCDGPVLADDLCSMHYQRQWRAAHPEAAEANRRRMREQYVPRDPQIVCRHCGEMFLRQPGMSGNRKYCSDECFTAARKAKRKQNAALPGKGRNVRSGAWCGGLSPHAPYHRGRCK